LPASEGKGPYSDDWRKSLALFLLYGLSPIPGSEKAPGVQGGEGRWEGRVLGPSIRKILLLWVSLRSLKIKKCTKLSLAMFPDLLKGLCHQMNIFLKAYNIISVISV
jgi:hypothetical protein